MKYSRIALMTVFLTSGFLQGCNGGSILDHVAVTPSQDLQNVQVVLVFANSVQTNISDTMAFGDFGDFFIQPYSPTQPFEIGFQLNLALFNDQNLVNLTPTSTLPNGNPIPSGVKMVQIAGDHPISSGFDIYGYADVLNRSWLGMAAMFNFINDKSFPEGLAVSQTFDNQNIVANVFGPTMSNGVLVKDGGIALFANVKALLTHTEAGKTSNFKPKSDVVISGKNAEHYRGNVKALYEVNKNLLRGFNGQ